MHPEYSEEEYWEVSNIVEQRMNEYNQDNQKKKAAYDDKYNSLVDDIIRSTIWAVLRRWVADLYSQLCSIFKR